MLSKEMFVIQYADSFTNYIVIELKIVIDDLRIFIKYLSVFKY